MNLSWYPWGYLMSCPILLRDNIESLFLRIFLGNSKWVPTSHLMVTLLILVIVSPQTLKHATEISRYTRPNWPVYKTRFIPLLYHSLPFNSLLLDIRTLYVLLLISFVDADNLTQTKTTFIEQHRNAFLAIFKGIGQDHYSLAKRILEVCWTGIWSDAKLKRTLKIGLFNEVTLGHVHICLFRNLFLRWWLSTHSADQIIRPSFIWRSGRRSYSRQSCPSLSAGNLYSTRYRHMFQGSGVVPKRVG